MSSCTMAMACVIQKPALMDFPFLVLIPILILLLNLNCFLASTEPIRIINRTSFPRDFIFGTASSSYQYEGEANGGGRGPNIWDTFTHKYPERIYDGQNGDESVDFYHRYKEDVSIMKDMGLDAFRLSISWSRILPSGKLSGGVNKQGIDFYNNLINELLANGLQPFVTIFHWDTPQPLEDDYGGFLSPRIVDDFEDFAQVCFREFGDRVKHWITMNGPDIYANLGYATGEYAPARCSQWLSGACKAGNSATEPYIVAHHLLLSHAAAAALYKNKYQALQRGEIGLTMSIDWAIPYSNTSADSEAAARAIDFMFGWFMEPLTYGEYPWIMRTLVGERLPILTKEQSEMVKGSFDFIGINYYSAKYAANIPFPNLVNISYSTDALANLTGVRNGVPIGPQAASIWIYSYPRGLYDLLIYTKERYNNPTIYITENGFDEYNNSTLSLNEALQDPMRIAYHHDHLVFLQQAIMEGVKVKGYFAWSLLDNFEWFLGYTVRFGFNFVDYDDGLKRYPKQSAIWFKNFLMKQAQHSDY